MPTPLASVLVVGTLDTEGEWLYEQALALQLEGIVGKRLDSLYYPAVRSSDWLKVKRPGAVPPERFRRWGGGAHSASDLSER